jgi:hypothetical protein
MKIIECAQGTREWHEARMGIPTASCFDKILTPTKLEPSKSCEDYMCNLLAARIEGMPADDEPMTMWMARGHEEEPRAAGHYAFTRGVDVKEVGHVTTEDGRIGCSPDRLVDDDGGLEIKCPKLSVHLANMLKMGEGKGAAAKYRLQVQGCLWVCERDWWDLLSYHPDHPECVRRFERDDEVIAKLSAALTEFCDHLDLSEETLYRLGCEPRRAIQEAAA